MLWGPHATSRRPSRLQEGKLALFSEWGLHESLDHLPFLLLCRLTFKMFIFAYQCRAVSEGLCAFQSSTQLIISDSCKIANNHRSVLPSFSPPLLFFFFFECVCFFNRLQDTLQQILHTGLSATIIINARKLCEGLPVWSKLALAENERWMVGELRRKLQWKPSKI